jgi:MoaA/NifB/PqqE/SkfB family radical SAM enzyme
MKSESQYLNLFQDNFLDAFNSITDLSLTNFRYCSFWIRTQSRQQEFAEIRQKRIQKGQQAPAVMICSITNRCNLNCKGCYSMGQNRENKLEIPTERFNRLFGEASEMGTGVVILAGGEPLLREDLLESAARHEDIIFPVFTNGVLMDSDRTRFFKQHKNLIPILSIEGDIKRTDERRGEGIYANVAKAAEVLRRNKQFYGMSITLTRDNFDEVTAPEYLSHFHKRGCRLFFFMEYVPVNENEISKCLSEEQIERLARVKEQLMKELPALYIVMPGEEKKYGGCLAAGRGFVHISASGDVEPCPFAPYSDINIMSTDLEEALESSFLSRIRMNHELLKESEGGCALWENSEWVEAVLSREMDESQRELSA